MDYRASGQMQLPPVGVDVKFTTGGGISSTRSGPENI